jgi:hypothetical protein
VLLYVSALLTICSRSTPQESLARRVAVLLFSSRTATSTDLVDKVSTTILSRAGCCITTMSTQILDTLMDRSSLDGTRLLGRMDGLLFRSRSSGLLMQPIKFEMKYHEKLRTCCRTSLRVVDSAVKLPL